MMRWLWCASVLVSLSSGQDFTCSLAEILAADGGMCCNDEAKEMVGSAMAGADPTPEGMQAAVNDIRSQAVDLFGGKWEALASPADFAYANYLLNAYHCKVSDPDSGATGLVWKIADDASSVSSSRKTVKAGQGGSGGGGGKAPATQKPAPATPRPATQRPATKKPVKKKNPNQKLLECCNRVRVAPPCKGANGYANLCDYNSYTVPNLVVHYFNQRQGPGCQADDLGKILQCAAGGADHTQCCADSKLADVAGTDYRLAAAKCSIFCYPERNLRSPTPEELTCGTGGAQSNLEKIKNCFIVYAKTGRISRPDYPRKRRFRNRAARRRAAAAARRRSAKKKTTQ